MNNFNSNQNTFIPDFTNLLEWDESSVTFDSQPCISGFTVQALDYYLLDYVNQLDVDQNNDGLFKPLSQYVVRPSTDVSLSYRFNRPDLYSGAAEPAPDKPLDMELNTTTDTYPPPPIQGASCGEAFVNFSQSSSRSVAISNPQHGNVQQNVQTEVVASAKERQTKCRPSNTFKQFNKKIWISKKIWIPKAKKRSLAFTKEKNASEDIRKAWLKDEETATKKTLPLQNKNVDQNASIQSFPLSCQKEKILESLISPISPISP